MLRHTFCHIQNVGEKSERWLWGAGLRSWDDLLGGECDRLPRYRVDWLRRRIGESLEELRRGNSHYFAERLPPGEHWRLFPAFRHSVAYLDIETNGFSGAGGYITTIAVYDGESIFHYVRGRNLADFATDIRKYKLLVTYYGKSFDLPFIERAMGLKLNTPHIDLCYLLRNLGYRGGLKGCEKQLGIDRKELDGITGYFAVLLWNDYLRKGNRKALETLLAYNIQDVLSLEHLMVVAYNLKLRNTPFEENRRLSVPHLPEIPFKVDIPTVDRLRQRRAWY